jgi:DNA-directed RNA polymerase subunit RPC12/RpoP
MSFIDEKYINLYSPRLEKFAKKKNGLYNFRCPYCGDSKRNRNRARGFFFRMKADYVYKCHNCGVGRSLANFLKDHDVILHDEYVMERFKNGITGKGTNTPTPKLEFEKPKFKTNILSGLDKLEELNSSHPAVEYLNSRRVPLKGLYYTDTFKQWTNTHKHTFDSVDIDEPRIIIPLIDDGEVFGFQGRSLNPKTKLRYITIMMDDSKPKVFGLNRIDTNEIVYVTEGPFDSYFLNNAIAMCGSDVNLSSYDYRFVYTYDNEPRSREIVNKIASTIKAGHKVVIFPKSIKEKDLNDMALAGHDVQSLVKSNTYSGLEATLKMNEWKKV